MDPFEKVIHVGSWEEAMAVKRVGEEWGYTMVSLTERNILRYPYLNLSDGDIVGWHSWMPLNQIIEFSSWEEIWLKDKEEVGGILDECDLI